MVLTGAGVSTASGIPDFRSPTGIWTQYDPLVYASIDAFLADPVKVWDFYAKRLELLARAEPNDAHYALADLEAHGFVDALITQNTDRLHERAGSRNVVEVHGSLRTSSCLSCGTVVPFDDVVARLPVPGCPTCGQVLKPDVVMFGEQLSPATIERAVELATGAGLLLVVGSSLQVYPVAELPRETLVHGGSLAIVNRGATQYDGRAAATFDEDAGPLLLAACDRLHAST